MASFRWLSYPFQKVSFGELHIFTTHATLLASRLDRERIEFQRFCRQLYHKCLELVFEPLRPFMTAPTVVKCPDGNFRRAVFGLGPYIADYPEQVWLAGIVSNWCAK